MKESGMEKLIELLNEYGNEKNPKTEYKWFSSYYKPLCYGFKVPFQGWHDNGEDYSEEIATSKQYGFIKWLVENDKINTESGPLYGFHFIMHNRQPYSLYETILMILAISDTPIEDLISYLK